jgi:hypothetical protein
MPETAPWETSVAPHYFRLRELPRRVGRRVALLARYPDRDPAMPQFIPNLGLYMIAAALRAPVLADLEVKTWDITGGNAERVAAEVIAFDPDIVGCSVYLWSLQFFLDVAVTVKVDDPARLVTFGGPSARPESPSARWWSAAIVRPRRLPAFLAWRSVSRGRGAKLRRDR